MHKIELRTGPDGYHTELVCPDDCTEQDVHKDQFADYGCELIPAVEEDTVLASLEVTPKWDGDSDEAELWLLPVIHQEG